MGFQDRYYNQQQQPFGPGGGMSFGLPRLTPMVKYLLIINCAVFVLQLIFREKLESLFAATGQSYIEALQVWRLITFQFLHSVQTPFHLLFNMIGLYFLGPVLERSWGSQKFLIFYLLCGAVGGLLFVTFSYLGWMTGFYLIGASGGVLGLLVACAILFPQIRVILFIFPMQIRSAAILFAIFYFLTVVTGGANAGGDLCHLGGMATGFIWVMGRGRFGQLFAKRQESAYKRKWEQQQKLQYEVDRILAKVHEQGVQSLTRKEKQILQQATEQQKNHMSGFDPDF